MSRVFITSDWHLGHKGAYRFSGDFSSDEERAHHILESYREVVTKRDIVWFLGDISFTQETLAEVDELPGIKRLILGNHDTDSFSKEVGMEDLLRVYQKIGSIFVYKKSWLTHAPIHPEELRGKINVHGHVHSETIPDERYVNLCLENTGFRPIEHKDIMGGWRCQ